MSVGRSDATGGTSACGVTDVAGAPDSLSSAKPSSSWHTGTGALRVRPLIGAGTVAPSPQNGTHTSRSPTVARGTSSTESDPLRHEARGDDMPGRGGSGACKMPSATAAQKSSCSTTHSHQSQCQMGSVVWLRTHPPVTAARLHLNQTRATYRAAKHRQISVQLSVCRHTSNLHHALC